MAMTGWRMNGERALTLFLPQFAAHDADTKVSGSVLQRISWRGQLQQPVVFLKGYMARVCQVMS
jgi:hypothetical protein